VVSQQRKQLQLLSVVIVSSLLPVAMTLSLLMLCRSGSAP